jgi:ribosomal protein S18 acetylase RimI-like enzyme
MRPVLEEEVVTMIASDAKPRVVRALRRLPQVLAHMRIRPVRDDEWVATLALWDRCGFPRARSDTAKDVGRRLRVAPEHFLLAVTDDRAVAASVLAWRERDTQAGRIGYLAVDRPFRRQGLAGVMVYEAENALRSLGCEDATVKLRADDLGAIAFWVQEGYVEREPLRFRKPLSREEVQG